MCGTRGESMTLVLTCALTSAQCDFGDNDGFSLPTLPSKTMNLPYLPYFKNKVGGPEIGGGRSDQVISS